MVVIDGRDSSEVWGGFRVGRRAQVQLTNDSDNHIEAWHDGYGIKVERTFELHDKEFVVSDKVDSTKEGISYIHFAPGVAPMREDNRLITMQAEVIVEGAKEIEIIDDWASVEYNRLEPIKVAKIKFNSKLEYKIVVK